MNKWKIVLWSVLVSVISFTVLLINNGYTEVGVRLCVRLSARISATFFAFAFMASSLHYFVGRPWTLWIMTNRKYLGISFAIIHLIHLVFLILLQVSFHPVFELAASQSLLGGGLAYLFLVLMLATSFEKFSSGLSAWQWTLLHTVGGYWIWFIFAKSYFKRVMTEMEYLPLLVLLGIVVLLRIGKLFAVKRKAGKMRK